MTPPRPLIQPDIKADEQPDSLGITAEVFASRMQRRLKENEAKQSANKQAGEARQSLLLSAMTTVRKALSATARISLGSRFTFDLLVSDWEGWPRIELALVDEIAPQRVDYSLIITAYDRKGIGTLQMSLHSGEVLARLHLDPPNEIEKLPLLLKKAVREFLDKVAEYVLNPKSPEELLEVQTKPIHEATFDEASEQAAIDKKLQAQELFGQEEKAPNGNIVDQVQELRPLEV